MNAFFGKHKMICLVWAAVLIMLIPKQGNAANVPVTGIQLDQSSLPLLTIGTEVSLQATIAPAEATNPMVHWTSSNSTVASVDAAGKVKALSPGSATIVVSTADGGKTAFCEVTVYGPTEGILLSPISLSLTSGGASQAMTATVTPAQATNKEVNWASTRPSVAQVNSQGHVTPLSAGTATIIATSVDGGHTATAQVTVTGVPVTRVSLNRTSLTMYRNGESATLTAAVAPSNATNRNVTWSSSNSSIVRVNHGVLTAVAAGRAIITVTTENGSKTATCEVTVFSDSGRATHLEMKRESSSRVELSWSGTSGNAYVELKRGSTVIDTVWSSNRKATFAGLSSRTEYDVYINDRYMDSFVLQDLSEASEVVRNFRVRELSSTSVELIWSGTDGSVYVEIEDEDRDLIEDAKRTSNREVTFSGLSANREYNVYIDGDYIDSFQIDDEDISSFTVKSKTHSTAEFTWKGTSGSVDIELRDNSNRTLFEKSTSGQSISFTGLAADIEYKVYIEGTYMQSFRTDRKDWAENFSYTKNLRTRTADLRWSGTAGNAEVILKTGNAIVKSVSSSNQRATFTGLSPTQDYAVYINDRYMEHISLSMLDIQYHWAKDAVNQLVEKGIISGYEDGQFKPDKNLNREEWITMLVKAKGYSLDAGGDTFYDVRPSYWAASFIQTALNQGIILASEHEDFYHPRKEVSREEAAVTIARALKLPIDESHLSFADQQTIQRKGEVGAVAQKGMIQGYPDQSFRPHNILTRAEAAVILNQIY